MGLIWNNWRCVKWFLPVVCGAVVFLCSCHQTPPQSPSYRNGQIAVKVDSVLLQTMETNQHLAEEADRALSVYVHQGYAQQELGYWSKGLRVVAHPIQIDEQVIVRQQVYMLDDELIEDTEQTITVGKNQLVQAVQDALPQMEHGQTVSLLVPWYLAYGATGTTQVAPYTNLRIEISVQ